MSEPVLTAEREAQLREFVQRCHITQGGAVGELFAEVDRLRLALAAANETIRRLREAVEPFARLLPACDKCHDEWPLYDAWSDTFTGAGDGLNCGHVRKLAALLPDPTPAKEG